MSGGWDVVTFERVSTGIPKAQYCQPKLPQLKEKNVSSVHIIVSATKTTQITYTCLFDQQC